MRPIILIGLLWLVAAQTTSAAESKLVEREWQVNGATRQALVYVPTEATKVETPVVFAFHGHGGTAKHAARTFGYQTIWPEAIVVYMQGLNTPGKLTDPEGKKSGWQHSLGAEADRDLHFFDAVLASLKTDYKVDSNRIYSTGHSNGGGFTYLLWANRGDLFAAVAPSAAVAGRGLKPLPALHVAGEADNLVRYNWQTLSISAIKKANGCAGEGKPWAKAGNLVGTQFASETGTPVVTLIHPGDHAFPAEAPKLIVQFFKEHAKQAVAVK